MQKWGMTLFYVAFLNFFFVICIFKQTQSNINFDFSKNSHLKMFICSHVIQIRLGKNRVWCTLRQSFEDWNRTCSFFGGKLSPQISFLNAEKDHKFSIIDHRKLYGSQCCNLVTLYVKIWTIWFPTTPQPILLILDHLVLLFSSKNSFNLTPYAIINNIYI